jgi:outer membrane protein assembly factor BamB
MIKRYLVVCMFFLLIVSTLGPLSFGYKLSEKNSILENYNSYNEEEVFGYGPILNYEDNSFESEKTNNLNEPSNPLNNPPMDSPWPMFKHDIRHTGRSPYNTSNISGDVKWWFKIDSYIWGAPVIDNNGDIYFGGTNLYAIYSNRTLKWSCNIDGVIDSGPAIDENGVIYVGSIWGWPNFLYAIYTNNGSLKWKFETGDAIYSSPAIGDDGSIYFGSEDDYIYAVYPNGTLKWKYLTSVAVLSSPAIGDDGTVYCGSHDGYLYAFYPDNGIVKWKFGTGNWVRVSPCIGDDGTIYCVSLDNYLYALYPNGTLKWKTYVGAGTHPTIGYDGTIYCGYDSLFAVNPVNGSVKWTFDVGGTIRGASPCVSTDGTIYFGTSDGGELFALNSDGTLNWKCKIGECESAPCIGSDGTVFVGNAVDENGGYSQGYLYAFNELEPNAPSATKIHGPISGSKFTNYSYMFQSTSPLENELYFFINWDDRRNTGWIGPYHSGERIMLNHSWNDETTFTIVAWVKDTENRMGPRSEFDVTIPRYKICSSSLLLRFLDRFPFLERLLQIHSHNSF